LLLVFFLPFSPCSVVAKTAQSNSTCKPGYDCCQPTPGGYVSCYRVDKVCPYTCKHTCPAGHSVDCGSGVLVYEICKRGRPEPGGAECYEWYEPSCQEYGETVSGLCD